MHHEKLGPLAEQVAEIRKDRAEGMAEEGLIKPTVLKIMHAENRSVFRAHGVTFVRNVGSESLSIKSQGIKGKKTETQAGS